MRRTGLLPDRLLNSNCLAGELSGHGGAEDPFERCGIDGYRIAAGRQLSHILMRMFLDDTAMLIIALWLPNHFYGN